MNGTTVSEVWASDELLEQTRAGVEVWRSVLGAVGRYDVSNFGAVRSWVRPASSVRRDSPKLLAPSRTNTGYLLVQIFIDGKRYSRPVHQLVCESFIGPRPGSSNEWEAGHQDDTKANNRLDNLKWCTKAVNGRDMIRNGRIDGNCRPVREIDGTPHYRCTKCNTWKPEADFGRITGKNARSSRCGLQPECRRCSTDRRNAWRRKARAVA